MFKSPHQIQFEAAEKVSHLQQSKNLSQENVERRSSLKALVTVVLVALSLSPLLFNTVSAKTSPRTLKECTQLPLPEEQKPALEGYNYDYALPCFPKLINPTSVPGVTNLVNAPNQSMFKI